MNESPTSINVESINNNENITEFPLGSVLLDLEETELPSIVTRVVDHMIACDEIPHEKRSKVIDVLLQRPKSNKESNGTQRRTSFKKPNKDGEEPFSRKMSIRKSLTKVFHVSAINSYLKYNTLDDSPAKENKEHTQIDLDKDEDEEKEERKVSNNKYPEGAEATAVLVGSVDFLKTTTVAFVRLAEGVTMENIIDSPLPVRFVYILLGPFQSEKDYYSCGESISKMMSDKAFHEIAYKAHSRGELRSGIHKFLNPNTEMNGNVLGDTYTKTGDLTDVVRIRPVRAISVTSNAGGGGGKKPHKRDPLQRTGKPFYGLFQDVKLRYSDYLSDIKDGLNPQVLSAAIFIFFAALSPAITFGGMYADQTDRYIGVGETLLVSSINGMIFALFAAQPILIVGATGPLMIFDMSLLQFCRSMDLDFLSIRVWVGIWIFIIGVLVAAFEAVSIVKKFTRFTEEIFSTFVCLIFIYGAFEKLAAIFHSHPLTSDTVCFMDMNHTKICTSNLFRVNRHNESVDLTGMLVNGSLHNGTNEEGEEIDDAEVLVNQPNTALLSMCLMIGTFLIAWKLKKFRNSKFLGRGVRRALGDFGVPIAIFLMVLLDYLISDTYTDKLTMPKGLQPSNSEVRGWFINPFGVIKPLPIWCMIAAGPAALLLFILIFLEENICHLILSKPERCLKKGSGFHLDIVLSTLINTIAGFLGAPFMGPACVRTISHMSALTVMGAPAPGESPKIVGCNEQRLSGFAVSLLIGLAVMLYAVLNLVPNAVLYGIFLYMGVSATAGIQLLERVVLFFMPVKHHPDEAYVKGVGMWKMHGFTVIQLILLIVLWVVKQSPAALAVPFVLICLIPIRLYLLPYIFATKELIALDGAESQTPEEIAEEEADFYETVHALPTQIENDHGHSS